MHYEEEWAEYVPRGWSLDGLEDPDARRAFRLAASELEDLGIPADLSALYWVFRLAQETDQLNAISRQVPWLDRIAVGFHGSELDNTGPGFGLIAYTNLPWQAEPWSDYFSVLERSVPGVEADGNYFPTSVRLGTRTLEVSITSPSQAQITAWARSNRTGQGGWLTARHAVDLGGPVWLSDGSTADVTEDWGDCIDAVICTPRGGAPGGHYPVPCVRGIGPGVTVEVLNAAGHTHSARVLDVDVNLGVVKHHRFPIRFSYDWETSVAGDSGACVRATPCDEPVGMHQGCTKLRNAAGGIDRHAYALCLCQLQDYGGLEVLQ